MRSTISLLKKLSSDHPDIRFVEGDDFHWSHSTRSVVYQPDALYVNAQLLHELAHAILGHQTYQRDIRLVEMEQEAWHLALTELSEKYSVELSDELIQTNMDSYRDWLHARSTCPNCKSTGIETKKGLYSCLICQSTWHVNEARTCGLKRSIITK